MDHLYSDPEAQSHRWAEYFEGLLTPGNESVNLAALNKEEAVNGFERSLSDDDGPPSCLEIEGALKKLKNYKSVGIDNLSNEQLKYGAPGFVPWLRDLFTVIWEQENIPSDWRKGIITIIPKKGDLTFCCNNRGITLRSTVFQISLLRRFMEVMD